MSTRVKWSILVVMLMLLAVASLGTLPAKAESPYSREEAAMVTIKVFPDKNWKAENLVTTRDYATFAEKLINGRAGALFTKYADSVANPDAIITYQSALNIASELLGYTAGAGVAKIKEVTKKLVKADTDQLNAYEVGYIFYNMLFMQRVGQTKNLLQERYVLGTEMPTTSKLLLLASDRLALEEEGTLPVTADLLAFTYDSNKRLVPMNLGSVAVGMTHLRYLLNDNKQVASIILPYKVYPRLIRVLISQDLSSIGGSNSYDFPELKIQADKNIKVVTHTRGADQIHYVAEDGEQIVFTNINGQIKVTAGKYSEVIKDRVYLKSFYPNKIIFKALSTKRNGKNPTFEGTLEIIPSQKAGSLYLINELSIEQYLKKVVPSEIPISWAKEAFKVQAIAARSYAISQIAGGRYEDKSANVDDSTACQVYNNNDENKIVNEAIKETAGVVPMYNGQVIDAVFASTFGGYSANSEDVWNDTETKAFPGTPVAYLKAQPQLMGNVNVPDLSVEQNALAFFKDWTLKSYDGQSSFFRWKLDLTREELESTINKNLPDREKADIQSLTDFIQTVSGNPINPDDKNFSIGTLKDLKVVQRGKGGNMMILDIVGTNGTYRILKEYNIRFTIRPLNTMTGTKGDVIMQRYDGSTLRNYSILPSAFCAFEIQRNEQGDIVKISFYGGGNGHGVGMSQWGMKGMVDAGIKYDEVLKHYYTGIELVKIY